MKIFASRLSGSARPPSSRSYPALRAARLRVSLIKHAHHTSTSTSPARTLAPPPRRRGRGARHLVAALVLMHELRGAQEPAFEQQLERLSPCDLLLVEGFKFAAIPKLEVWRAATASAAASNDPHIVAVAATGASRPSCSGFTSMTTGNRELHRQIPETGMNQSLLSVDDALQLLLSKARAVVDIQEVPTLEATNRVLARAQRSTMDVPPMDNSAMDGYALRVQDVSMPLEVKQRIQAGAIGGPLEPGTAARIFTGAPIRRAPMRW